MLVCGRLGLASVLINAQIRAKGYRAVLPWIISQKLKTIKGKFVQKIKSVTLLYIKTNRNDRSTEKESISAKSPSNRR